MPTLRNDLDERVSQLLKELKLSIFLLTVAESRLLEPDWINSSNNRYSNVVIKADRFEIDMDKFSCCMIRISSGI